MNDVWNGVPENPERDGAHWVLLHGDNEPSVIMWTAKRRYWTDLGGAYPAAMYGGESVYLGPCALPSEVAALRAALDAAEKRADLTWFWQIVDRAGLANVPSDEGGALSHIIAERDAAQAALLAAWRQGVEAAAGHVFGMQREWEGARNSVLADAGYAIRARQPPADLAAAVEQEARHD